MTGFPKILLISKTLINDVDSSGASLRNWFNGSLAQGPFSATLSGWDSKRGIVVSISKLAEKRGDSGNSLIDSRLRHLAKQASLFRGTRSVE